MISILQIENSNLIANGITIIDFSIVLYLMLLTRDCCTETLTNG